MNWVELSIVVNHEVEPLVTNILENFGSNGVVIEDSHDLIQPPADKYGEIYELKSEDYPEFGVRLKAYFNEIKFTKSLATQIKKRNFKFNRIRYHSFYL